MEAGQIWLLRICSFCVLTLSAYSLTLLSLSKILLILQCHEVNIELIFYLQLHLILSVLYILGFTDWISGLTLCYYSIILRRSFIHVLHYSFAISESNMYLIAFSFHLIIMRVSVT